MRNDRLASSRPLMVNTTALLAVMRPQVARWTRCRRRGGGAEPPQAKPRANYLARWVNDLFGKATKWACTKMGLARNSSTRYSYALQNRVFIAGVAVFIVFTACLPTWIRLLRHDAVFV